MDEKTAAFELNRRVLEGLAYRMLGTLAEAQDVVQETYLRWREVDLGNVGEPRAWLITVCSRLAINALKSARVRRETYVGTWLPEPFVDAGAPSPADQLEVDETISVGLMLALEKLSPLERAAFLLHEVFDYSFDEIAAILGKTSAACRKLASRARLNVRSERPRFEAPADKHLELVRAFLDAARAGGVESMQRLLAQDVVFHADGGGKAQTATEILRGVEAVAGFFLYIWTKQAATGKPIEVVAHRFNGAPGLLIYEAGQLITALGVRVESDLIQEIYAVRNPDKLAVFPALAHGRR